MLFDCYNLLQVAKILNNYNKCHVWAQVEKRISGLPLVAHNRPYALADGEACAATALKILYWTLAYSAQLLI